VRNSWIKVDGENKAVPWVMNGQGSILQLRDGISMLHLEVSIIGTGPLLHRSVTGIQMNCHAQHCLVSNGT
jgi:hypothetical protein